ncbi:MAG: phosphotransferase, partial [Actinobacteria bacterium]|nr:phosphotransferase [Actinomycetota bacterium]
MEQDDIGSGIRQPGAPQHELKERLEGWLAPKYPASARPRVSALETPSSNGLSSETVLFDAEWSDRGAERRDELVARFAPHPESIPVFPSYDLDRQARVMAIVRETTTIPVPAVRWSEPDPHPLGRPFFVMERLHGQVPADLMPYNMIGFLTEASADERERLQRSTVSVLASLFAIDAPTARFGFLADGAAEGDALQQHRAEQEAYYEWVAAGRPIPIV